MRVSKFQSAKRGEGRGEEPKGTRGEPSAFPVRHSLGDGGSLQPLAFGPQRAVALVITLIMLAVITFLAIAFLVLSQRENASSMTALDQKTAQMASDTAFNRVCAELLADAMVNTNFQSFGIKVSTNFINQNGFNAGLNPQNPTNVNYDFLINNGGQVNQNQNFRNENIASLEFNPRAPVFVTTNSSTGSNDFRFYIDENRNGRFDTNGVLPVIVMNAGVPSYLPTNSSLAPVAISSGPPYPWLLSNNFTGDPEWVGVLERPWEMHSADNKFTSRFAYLVVPASDTLDINYIHNRAKQISTTGEGFYRNQGVGTFEDNLAGFLADLNTNMWWTNSGLAQYLYNTNPAGTSTGIAFSDANDLLSYRYGGPNNNTYGNLDTPRQLFASFATPLVQNHIDYGARGPLMLGTTPAPPPALATTISPLRNWSGADNTNHVFGISDFFDASKVGPNFPARLASLGTSNDSYNAYTYYRMLAQLGSDSMPEPKLNVNFKNTDIHGKVVPGLETNLMPWTPTDFFTNAADRMFRQLNLLDMNSNLITVTNIPIYEDTNVATGLGGVRLTNFNYYTPAVQRILQLAANIYDASTNRILAASPVNYPSVFRPIFTSQNGVVRISGYAEVTDTTPLNFVWWDLAKLVARPSPAPYAGINVYGVPWVIGAKKGLPNFNEMSLANPLTVQRNLMFTNTTGNGPPWITNQMINIGISNSFGVEAWNSYSTTYPQSLTMYATNIVTMQVSNEVGATIINFTNVPFGNSTNIPAWQGRQAKSSFQVPLVSSLTNLASYGIYLDHAPWLDPLSKSPEWSPLYVPHFYMEYSCKFQFYIVDNSVNRIIDFVNIVDTEPTLDVAAMLQGNALFQRDQVTEYDVWETNTLNGGVSLGVLNQIDVGESIPPGYQNWKDPAGHNLINSSASGNFANYLNNQHTNSLQDPYPAQGSVWRLVSWQANDPLVHYTQRDLTSTNGQGMIYNTNAVIFSGMPLPQAANLPNVGQMNVQYQPWGGYPPNPNNPTFDKNYMVKDPLISSSDDWDFPTNKFWDIGILGRVHRGTPWQTINLKPFNTNTVNWSAWANNNTGFTNSYPGGNVFVDIDGILTQPNQDYRLFDVFASSVNENAAHGQLNVNQTNIAAWSAVLSGVNVLSNGPNNSLIATNIQPAGFFNLNDPNQITALARIWAGITNTLASTNLDGSPRFPNGFQSAGDILNTPQLTVASPFINHSDPTATATNDEVLERIPQQVMSLLTLNHSPRFVIYSFGQTLHPANNSLVVGGTFNGLCTNYQITAEIATRAVVRVDGSSDPQFTQAHPDPQGRYYPPRIVVEQFNVLGPD